MKRAPLVFGALGCLALLGLVGAVWTYQRATRLPDWYTQGEPSPQAATPEEPFAAAPPSAMDPQPAIPEQGIPDGSPRVAQVDKPGQPGGGKSAKQKRSGGSPRFEERNFHRRTLLGQSAWSSAIVASRLVFDNGRLEVAFIVSPTRVDRSQLQPREAAALDRALALIPGASDKPVALTLIDKPVRDAQGQLEISSNATIQLGDVGFELNSFVQRLGGQGDATRRSINREIRRLVEPTLDDDQP